MAPQLILGPLLRYAGERDATLWVETDAACEVEVLGHKSATFEIEGHHYALVMITDLEPGETYEYEVLLDGGKVWPEGDFPPSVIRTISPDGKLDLFYGSCRVTVPHELSDAVLQLLIHFRTAPDCTSSPIRSTCRRLLRRWAVRWP